LNIDPDDTVKAFMKVKRLGEDVDFTNSHYIVMGTKKGVIKKSLLADYSRPRQNGVIALTVKEDDELISARLTNGSNEVLLATRSGRAIRFNESIVRTIGRTGQGVRGITLASDKDEVVGMVCVKNMEEDILVVSEKGFGKRSKIEDYRVTNRGGKGVKTMRITDKTGDLIAIKSVTDEHDLMIINRSGITLRLSVADMRTTGRATQGVRLINLDKKQDAIASVTRVMAEQLEEELLEGEGLDSTDQTENQSPENSDN
jgi:DNA gyrase subunit A